MMNRAQIKAMFCTELNKRIQDDRTSIAECIKVLDEILAVYPEDIQSRHLLALRVSFETKLRSVVNSTTAVHVLITERVSEAAIASLKEVVQQMRADNVSTVLAVPSLPANVSRPARTVPPPPPPPSTLSPVLPAVTPLANWEANAASTNSLLFNPFVQRLGATVATVPRRDTERKMTAEERAVAREQEEAFNLSCALEFQTQENQQESAPVRAPMAAITDQLLSTPLPRRDAERKMTAEERAAAREQEEAFNLSCALEFQAEENQPGSTAVRITRANNTARRVSAEDQESKDLAEALRLSSVALHFQHQPGNASAHMVGEEVVDVEEASAIAFSLEAPVVDEDEAAAIALSLMPMRNGAPPPPPAAPRQPLSEEARRQREENLRKAAAYNVRRG